LIRLATDSERFAAQGWIAAFFDGTEKSIEVEVQDFTWLGHGV
jgi:hypothetical protein